MTTERRVPEAPLGAARRTYPATPRGYAARLRGERPQPQLQSDQPTKPGLRRTRDGPLPRPRLCERTFTLARGESEREALWRDQAKATRHDTSHSAARVADP